MVVTIKNSLEHYVRIVNAVADRCPIVAFQRRKVDIGSKNTVYAGILAVHLRGKPLQLCRRGNLVIAAVVLRRHITGTHREGCKGKQQQRE